MKTINANTQRGNNFINAYNRATAWTLSQVYGRFSCAKACAERECRERMTKEGGHGFRIMSANCFQFSCGWMTAEGLRVETACGSYLIAE